MALNNNREQYWKIFRRAVVAVFLLIVVMVNITEFKRLISSNPQKITEYHLPEDIYAELRNPVLSVTYYTVPEGLPKIVVLPYRYLNGFLQNLKKDKQSLTSEILRCKSPRPCSSAFFKVFSITCVWSR